MNFFITGLPRSRTAWLANFFSTGDVFCWHEAMAGVGSQDEYWKRMRSPQATYVGNSDCGLFMGGYRKGCPLVIIERDLDEVEEALFHKGFPGTRSVLIESKEAMDEMVGLRIPFEDINDRLEEIHNTCVTTPFNEQRAEQLIKLRVELTEIVPDPASIRVWR